MESKLLLNVQKEEIDIALLEDSTLVEYTTEDRTASFAVGNIYVAKVKKLLPGLNAAFVEVGYEKEGFLHYLDLGAYFITIDNFLKRMKQTKGRVPSMSRVEFAPETTKEGVITDHLQVGQTILVQIAKEPISTKGPRLTTEISLAGRSLVLMPFSNKISVSQKIKQTKERNRLRKAVAAVCPKNYGAIIRTASEGRETADLQNELGVLVKRWEQALKSIQKSIDKAPALVVEEVNRAEAVLRDHLNRNYESILINDKSVFDEIKSYIGLIEPSKSDIVKYYEDEVPLFDVYNVTRQLKQSFGRIVSLKKGAYLVIDHTEALHVVDVNSGTRISKGVVDQEENAYETNLLAVDEVAHQMRLRDMGGIVIIDLIDMHDQAHKQLVYERMVEKMAPDKAKHNVLPLSKFGLMQITRQRVRPVTHVNTREACPVCGGSGKVNSSILFTEMLERKTNTVLDVLQLKKVRLYVHPYVYAYFKQGFPSLKLKWSFKFKFVVKILPDANLEYLQYRFVDKDGEPVDVKSLENILAND